VRLHDIEMRDQQHRLLLAVAAQARDDVALLRIARMHEHLHVCLRKSCGDESRCYCTRCLRVVADGIRRVDLDQFFVDVVQRALLRLELGRAGGAHSSERSQECEDCSSKRSFHDRPPVICDPA